MKITQNCIKLHKKQAKVTKKLKNSQKTICLKIKVENDSFKIAEKCLSIIFHITNNFETVPISTVNRILNQHNIPILLTELLKQDAFWNCKNPKTKNKLLTYGMYVKQNYDFRSTHISLTHWRISSVRHRLMKNPAFTTVRTYISAFNICIFRLYFNSTQFYFVGVHSFFHLKHIAFLDNDS